MDKINWNNSSGDDFMLFCNALLSFEFGKTFQPFSAPGKDGGIDGAFKGSYQQKSGSWRFQYKFRLGARAQNYSGLKTTVKTELQSLNDESFYVLLTNIEMLPQEILELQKTLDNEISSLGKQCECIIWDGAKLFNLYLQYPLLQLWLQDGFQTAQLQNYHMVFKKEMAKSSFSPGTLSNAFFARYEDLQDLVEFVAGDATLALVTGEAGIGKTRLVLEFFNKRIDPNPEWTPLVLVNRNVDFDKIRNALTGNQNFILLIDDAHTYAPEVIADIQRISTVATNKIKVILTARNLEAFRSISLVKEYERVSIPHVKLKELSRADTSIIFNQYVSGHAHYVNFIPQLVEISYGKPILIVAILDAIEDGVKISKIREEGFLRNYVLDFFNSYYASVEQLIGWSKVQAKRFLQHVVLIEPFSYGDANLIQKITNLQGLTAADGVAALKLLRETDLVDGRHLQSIKPDYYSDILLAEIDRNEVANYIGEFINNLDNIVINLSSVDESTNSQSQLLDEILTEYVSFIKNSDQIATIERVLSTIANIAGYQPKVAQKAVKVYIDSFQQEEHAIYIDFKENKAYSSNSAFTPLNKVIELLSYLSGLPEFYDFCFRKSMQLFSLTHDNKIVGLFAFSRKDLVEQFKFPRQQFFLKEFGNKLKKMNGKDFDFCLQVIKSWLNLEFIVSGASAANRFEINITTYYLPANGAVKKLRKNIVELLIKIYANPDAIVHRLEIIKDLLDVPRSILATNKNPKPYVNNEEIETVLNFLEREAGQFDLKEKKEIEEKLFLFRRWGISKEFFIQLDAIKEKLAPKDLSEQLSQIFSKAEVSFSDLNNIVVKLHTACDNLIKQFDATSMAGSLIEFLESELYQPPYFYAFLERLIERHPDYAKVFYQRMANVSSKLFNLYGSSILGGAYYTFKDHDFYWAEVRKLQGADTIEADNMLLSVYGRRVPGNTLINSDDVEVILTVFNKKRRENNFNLANGIQSLIVAEYEHAQQVCIEFLENANQREAEMFFIWLSDNKVVKNELLTELVLNHTFRFYLSYEIERCLNKVLHLLGKQVIFDYFNRRFEYKKAIVVSRKTLSGYEFVPDGDHSHLFDGIPEQKGEMFIMALEWYLELDSEGGHLFYAKDLLEYLKPGDAIDQDSLFWYKDKIEQFEGKASGLDRIVDSLSIFHVKEDNLLDLVIIAYTAAHDLHETEPEFFQVIREDSYTALTTMGVKFGTAGEPFQVDLELQSLLQVKITGMPEYMPATSFLKEVLRNVELEISRSSDRDNLRW